MHIHIRITLPIHHKYFYHFNNKFRFYDSNTVIRFENKITCTRTLCDSIAKEIVQNKENKRREHSKNDDRKYEMHSTK